MYLASPLVDDKGPLEAYRRVHEVLSETPDVWLDPFEIRLIGLKDSLAEAASAVIKPKVADSRFAVQPPRPYPGMTRFNGSTLGGMSVDGALIYPPLQQTASHVRESGISIGAAVHVFDP